MRQVVVSSTWRVKTCFEWTRSLALIGFSGCGEVCVGDSKRSQPAFDPTSVSHGLGDNFYVECQLSLPDVSSIRVERKHGSPQAVLIINANRENHLNWALEMLSSLN